jgi:hypothetical protein
MSALGQKQTFALQNGVSALHPKADMGGAKSNVCFGPIADMAVWVYVAPKIKSLTANDKTHCHTVWLVGASEKKS